MIPRDETTRLASPVTGRDHVRGSREAPVVLVEYGDYECPYTRKARSVISRLEQELEEGLLFVYRDFPLTEIHPHAQLAAEDAQAAGAQGDFWKMHDLLFDNQQALEAMDLAYYAASVGLDTQRFEQELTRRQYANRVREDLDSGLRSGVMGTSTFYVNDFHYDGPADFDGLLNVIRRATPESGGA